MSALNIRGLNTEAHRQLRMKAAEAGLSLNQYLVDELSALAELPTRDQMTRRFAQTKELPLKKQPEEYVRKVREAA